jgi:hypothetical protein
MTAAARTCSVVVGFVLAAATAAHADSIVITPASSLEIVDFAPIDGQDLQEASPIAQFVSFGPGAEARLFYEFELGGLSAAPPRRPVVLQAHRTKFPFSSCSDLTPCPDLTRFDIFGYAGTGAIGLDVYNAGVFLARVNDVAPGQNFNVDVSGFIAGLTVANVDFAGFAIRPAAQGAMELSDARLAVTPEPGSLTLLTVGGLAGLARRRIARRQRS